MLPIVFPYVLGQGVVQVDGVRVWVVLPGFQNLEETELWRLFDDVEFV